MPGLTPRALTGKPHPRALEEGGMAVWLGPGCCHSRDLAGSPVTRHSVTGRKGRRGTWSMITRPTRSDGVTSIQPGTANQSTPDVGAEVCRGEGRFIGKAGITTEWLNSQGLALLPGCLACVHLYRTHRTREAGKAMMLGAEFAGLVSGSHHSPVVRSQKKGDHPMWQPHLATPSVGWHPVHQSPYRTSSGPPPGYRKEWERGEPSPRIPVRFDAPRAPRSDCRGALCSGSRIA